MLAEARGLTEAIHLQPAGERICPILRPSPAHLVGKGQLEEIGSFIEENKIELAFVNHALSPVQQRNLERAWKAKVIDRTGLILEIFGERARTAEGMLQVELAALSYQRSRLVRSWTHLERQRGGFGFLGGPGESQLEIDRRLIGRRILKIKSELQQVRRMRALHRKARERAEQPVIALVGYTNAGKSTLFNRLTQAGVFAENLLFATLDPTMRQIILPSNKRAMLSDTVGFIADLPTHLVEAFRATLEEVETADLILHVRDVAHAETRAQKEDVEKVLQSLGIKQNDPRMIEVLNKIDLLDENARAKELPHARRMGDESVQSWAWQGVQEGVKGGVVAISALSGEGVDELLALLDKRLDLGSNSRQLRLKHEEGARLAWLYGHGQILSRQDGPRHIRLDVRLSDADWGRYQALFGKV
ncbi:MAG TPA: GTPase HflX [Alphaproteobacteria bacterium]|nr:GTPase HflX [Alphaproteobacteria bacterium]